MLAVDVIRKPLVTEKTTFGSSELNRYTFEVDRQATKDDIRKAISELYDVRVLDVATQNRKGRLKRNRFGFWVAKAKKIAVVRVHPEDKIELF